MIHHFSAAKGRIYSTKIRIAGEISKQIRNRPLFFFWYVFSDDAAYIMYFTHYQSSLMKMPVGGQE